MHQQGIIGTVSLNSFCQHLVVCYVATVDIETLLDQILYKKVFTHFYMFFSHSLFNMTCAPCWNHVDRYIFKATVTLANHHKAWSSWVYFPCWTDHLLSHIATVQVTLSNPEKHAQPSLPEAVDHMVDVLKKFLGKTMVSYTYIVLKTCYSTQLLSAF